MDRIVSTRDIKDVWADYFAAKSDKVIESLRNTLAVHYMHLVQYAAERIHKKLPAEVELDDLVSAGTFGLMDAIKAYDLTRGVKFETYSAPRIRGAILDELRNMDWVPRLVRSRSTKVRNTNEQLHAELGRPPTGEEIASMLGVDQREFEKILGDAKPVGVVSLSRKWFETDSNKDVREVDMVADNTVTTSWGDIFRRELKEFVGRGLSRSERLIIVLYYFENMTMKEIGSTLDLSESRVSQMHSNIIARLKSTMADKKYLFVNKDITRRQLPS